MTPKVTAPGHLNDLTSSSIFKAWEPVKDTSKIHTLWNSQWTIRTYVSTICISRIFLYRWPQVMSFSWPSHYKSMVKNWSTSNAHQMCPTQGRIQGGAAGGGRPSLHLGIRRPLRRVRPQTCPFLLVSEVLSLLSLLRGALLRTWRATSPCQWHLGILIHTRAPFSTPGRLPPHKGALLHTGAPSFTPGRSPPYQGALLYTRALSSTPGRSPPHQGALLDTMALFSTPWRSPPHQGAVLHPRTFFSTPGHSPPHHGALLHTKKSYTTPGRPITQHGALLCTTGALLRTRGIFLCGRGALLCNRGASSTLLTKVLSSTSSSVLVTRGLTTAFPLSISGQTSPHQRTPRPSSMMHHPQTGATSS